MLSNFYIELYTQFEKDWLLKSRGSLLNNFFSQKFFFFFLIKNPFIIRAVKAKSGGGSSFLFSCITGNCYWYVFTFPSCITSQLSTTTDFFFAVPWLHSSVEFSTRQSHSVFLVKIFALTIHETFSKEIYCARV